MLGADNILILAARNTPVWSPTRSQRAGFDPPPRHRPGNAAFLSGRARSPRAARPAHAHRGGHRKQAPNPFQRSFTWFDLSSAQPDFGWTPASGHSIANFGDFEPPAADAAGSPDPGLLGHGVRAEASFPVPVSQKGELRVFQADYVASRSTSSTTTPFLGRHLLDLRSPRSSRTGDGGASLTGGDAQLAAPQWLIGYDGTPKPVPSTRRAAAASRPRRCTCPRPSTPFTRRIQSATLPWPRPRRGRRCCARTRLTARSRRGCATART